MFKKTGKSTSIGIIDIKKPEDKQEDKKPEDKKPQPKQD